MKDDTVVSLRQPGEFTEVGIPFTDLAGRAIQPGWTAARIPLRVLTTRARSRKWTNGSGTTRHAVSTSGACAGRRGSSARTAA